MKGEWTPTENGYPSKTGQAEVIFFVDLYHWKIGMFTPAGKFGETENVFHEFIPESDSYKVVSGVKAWIELPTKVKK